MKRKNGGLSLMNDNKDNMRGGLSCIFHPLAFANNPWAPGYQKDKETSLIVYVDATAYVQDGYVVGQGKVWIWERYG